MQNNQKDEAKSLNKLCFVSSLLLAVITASTLIIAILTPPISGPFSAGVTITYPYSDIISRFPRDYYWMYPAMLLVLNFVLYVIFIGQNVRKEQKIFIAVALSFACISAGIIFIDYYVQVSVIQPSLINGEYEAIALFTQYNPHGLFIVLEEAGYIFMSIAILFLTPIFTGPGKIRTILKWTSVLNFTFSMLSLIIISAIYGISREYRFEVAIITFNFMSLILLGLFSALLCYKELTTQT